MQIIQNSLQFNDGFYIAKKEVELMPWKLQTDDSEILVYYIKFTADINFFVISWQ